MGFSAHILTWNVLPKLAATWLAKGKCALTLISAKDGQVRLSTPSCLLAFKYHLVYVWVHDKFAEQGDVRGLSLLQRLTTFP